MKQLIVELVKNGITSANSNNTNSNNTTNNNNKTFNLILIHHESNIEGVFEIINKYFNKIKIFSLLLIYKN